VKILILYSLSFLFTWFNCGIKTSSDFGHKPIAANLQDTISFTEKVQPILVKNCSPCHFTCGKMYDKLPFDKDTTILNHEKGILKRIKKEEENAVIRNFILQNKNSSSE
jgi:hypothetical protein